MGNAKIVTEAVIHVLYIFETAFICVYINTVIL